MSAPKSTSSLTMRVKRFSTAMWRADYKRSLQTVIKSGLSLSIFITVYSLFWETAVNQIDSCSWVESNRSSSFSGFTICFIISKIFDSAFGALSVFKGIAKYWLSPMPLGAFLIISIIPSRVSSSSLRWLKISCLISTLSICLEFPPRLKNEILRSFPSFKLAMYRLSSRIIFFSFLRSSSVICFSCLCKRSMISNKWLTI